MMSEPMTRRYGGRGGQWDASVELIVLLILMEAVAVYLWEMDVGCSIRIPFNTEHTAQTNNTQSSTPIQTAHSSTPVLLHSHSVQLNAHCCYSITTAKRSLQRYQAPLY